MNIDTCITEVLVGGRGISFLYSALCDESSPKGSVNVALPVNVFAGAYEVRLKCSLLK
jgi:hypothetical protein